ncbi:hypothetical protein GY45DRAFT_1244693 [Cubamyces sp. BRFM 1775]|nr:hypothetical protein GY45DRAFT_1244693 [Cubamyces sp. BRFM 1775]
MQPVQYYQIGGFRAHLRDNSNDALAAKLMGRDGAELVLGIRPCGASYLLLPRDTFHAMRLGWPRASPWQAHDFESLSPVQFPTKLDLASKFAMLTSNKKSNDGKPRDRSKANTAFTAGGDGLSPAGIARSSFEHQRVFYRLCQSSIEKPIDYALQLAPWFQNVRIFSFAFNTWASDTRPLDERQAEPRVLDVGWTEFNSPTDSDDLRAMSTSHYFVEEDRYLSNPRRKKLFLPDISQYSPRDAIRALLQDTFGSREGQQPVLPKILLVHDEKMAICVLRSFGIDTSAWKIGIKDLLYSQEASRTRQRNSVSDNKDYRKDRKEKWARDRSRSPRRHISSVEPNSRPRSPPSPHRLPPAYIVDVRNMYQTLMQLPPRDDSILAVAQALNVRDTAPVRGEDDGVVYEDVDPTSWLLGYMWEDMANSIAIDEQRVLRHRFSKEPIEDWAGPAGGHGDDDADPNDVLQPASYPNAPVSTARPMGMFDSDSEDDEW